MNLRKFNWFLWAGLLLSVIAFFSYFFFFVRFPVTRDFPWVNLLMFAIAAVFLTAGVRRGFAADRPHPRRAKITASVIATLSLAILAFFVVAVFVIARDLPPSAGAPKVGQKAPAFTLNDSNGELVSLTEILASRINGKPARGVLLVFYRGYW